MMSTPWTMTLRMVLFSVFLLCACQAEDDPCTSYKPYPDMDKRAPDSHYQSGNPISDKVLSKGWYGSPGRDLARSPPPLERCGTRFPLWLKDSTETEAVVCIVSETDNCKVRMTLEKKSCGSFPVYKLRRTQSNSAYCVVRVTQEGTTVPPVYTAKPEVKAKIVDKCEKSELVFNCNFPKSTSAKFYTVHWIANERNIKSFRPERYSDVKSNTVLTEAILEQNEITKPGFQLQCSVQAHNKQDGPGSNQQNSTTEFIGIKIMNKEISVVEGACQHVKVQMTAPFGCGADKDDCSLSTELFDLSNSSESSERCGGRTVMRTACSTNRIQKTKWSTPVILEVCGKIGIQYGSLRVTRKLQLKTGSFLAHEFWQDCDIGDILVHITRNASSIKGKMCSSVNDPHLTTFSGRRFEHHSKGVFTLYKHLQLPLEVQLDTRFCQTEKARVRCNCGLAIRAGQTVFVFDRCDRKTWDINYKQVQQGDTLLDIRQKGSNYRLNRKWLNVHLSPSVKDSEQTGGLCGKLTTGCAEEMTLRDGTVSNDRYVSLCSHSGYVYFPQFLESWRVEERNNFFDNQKNLKPWPSSEMYCSCPIAAKRDTFVDRAECSAQKTSEECIKMPGYKPTLFKRQLAKRRRRSVEDVDVSQFLRLRRATNESTWRNGWTEERAKERCQEMFNLSKSVEMCRDVSNVHMTPSEENCVSDIKDLGNDDFIMVALDDVRNRCVHEVMMDPEMHNNTDGKQSKLEMMMDFGVCPNECNQKGNCTNGECKCVKGFGGVDCSVDLTKPPEVTELQQNDGCVLGKCNVTSVYGETFVDSAMLKCRVKQIKVYEDSSIQEGTVQEVFAEAVSIAEVRCQLPEFSPPEGATKTYVNGFRVSVSNTGTLYSQELDMLVLDPKCQRLVNKEGSGLKWERHGSHHCIQHGKCVAEGATKPDGTICSPEDKKSSGATKHGSFQYWVVLSLTLICWL